MYKLLEFIVLGRIAIYSRHIKINNIFIQEHKENKSVKIENIFYLKWQPNCNYKVLRNPSNQVETRCS